MTLCLSTCTPFAFLLSPRYDSRTDLFDFDSHLFLSLWSPFCGSTTLSSAFSLLHDVFFKLIYSSRIYVSCTYSLKRSPVPRAQSGPWDTNLTISNFPFLCFSINVICSSLHVGRKRLGNLFTVWATKRQSCGFGSLGYAKARKTCTFRI